VTTNSLPESAETLRMQAEACRRLARSATTEAGAAVLHRLAEEHDRQADTLEPGTGGDG
jgi:hypothetical protein